MLLFPKQSLAVVCASLLTACGGSSSSDTDPTPTPTPQAAVMSLAVSDAPVEDVHEVVVCFTAIELKSDSVDNVDIIIGESETAEPTNTLCVDDNDDLIPNTKGIDLLSVTGVDAEPLFTDLELPAGTYNQLRLVMGDGSYATLDLDQDGVADDSDADGVADKVPLRVPSNELKLDGFTLAQGQVFNATVEFDLRKAMTNPVGQDGYILKPRGVRLVDNAEIGHIEGTVSEALLLNSECPVMPQDLTTAVASVYAYAGTGHELTDLADNGGSEAVESLTSSAVLYDGATSYDFTLSYLPAGDYTLALTCDEDADPEGDDDVMFLTAITATVEADGTTEVVIE
ncbi:DUF4382 domain-containing protein [Aestuariibacter halophilus]|uniref:DUF4382 domain-containing protein n=1 Tax=Fluctibacter halophilus TaxID=226011 RepID=A0ABS8GCM2_9ALTE|nr:DUF4382 domain-containing protein [Aestuariibacter halophilus]MCC2618307.1 DUF4382 domain-containing protein [Aestuariibacter halophilus]